MRCFSFLHDIILFVRIFGSCKSSACNVTARKSEDINTEYCIYSSIFPTRRTGSGNSRAHNDFPAEGLTFFRKWSIVTWSDKYGPVAQLGERSVRIREVKGSNPSRSTTKPQDQMILRLFRCIQIQAGSATRMTRRAASGASARIFPLWACAIPLAMDSPRPCPPFRLLRDWSAR